MQALAAWLVARPLNATLALAATSTPVLGFLSSALIVLLVLRQGVRLTAIEAMFAAGLLAGVSLLFGSPVPVAITVALVFWVPAMLLAVVLGATRSLTLTLQLSVIATVVCVLAFRIVVADPVAFWEPHVEVLFESWRQQSALELGDLVAGGQMEVAAQATMIVAAVLWSIYAATFVLGYLLYRQLPGEPARYGRFRELNFGRVIALAMALASVAAVVSGTGWLQDTAFVMFAVFWLQGLALVHWMHGQSLLPLFAVVGVYVLMLLPVLSAMMLTALAVTGYIDAWFRLRRLRPAA